MRAVSYDFSALIMVGRKMEVTWLKKPNTKAIRQNVCVRNKTKIL
jgi:hypothetical protein